MLAGIVTLGFEYPRRSQLSAGGLVLGLLHPIELPSSAPHFSSIGSIIIDF